MGGKRKLKRKKERYFGDSCGREMVVRLRVGIVFFSNVVFLVFFLE